MDDLDDTRELSHHVAHYKGQVDELMDKVDTIK